MSDLHLCDEPTDPSPHVKRPPNLTSKFSYTPSDDGTDENLLILLHGLGDTHLPFSNLGKSLKLPQTAVLALHTPEQVPFLYENVWQWYPFFDALGEPIVHPDPMPALNFLNPILTHLTGSCTWPLDQIHLFGFAQGGTVTAELALMHWKTQLMAPSTDMPCTSFASVVSVSGPLLSYPTLSVPCPIPVLLAHRPPPAESALPTGTLASFKKVFVGVTESKMSTKCKGMPVGRNEWEPIMHFWSQHLSKRRVEGLYKVMGGMTSPS